MDSGGGDDDEGDASTAKWRGEGGGVSMVMSCCGVFWVSCETGAESELACEEGARQSGDGGGDGGAESR
jgi:hypothetical protein